MNNNVNGNNQPQNNFNNNQPLNNTYQQPMNNMGQYYNNQSQNNMNQNYNQMPIQNNQQQMYYNNLNMNDRKNNNKKSIWKLFIIFLIVLAIVGTIAILLFNKNNNSSNHMSSGTRTIMIYMVGSDLESKAGAASTDIQEIIGANVNLEDVNVVVYAGGSKKWYNGFENNTIYELTTNGFKEVKKDNTKSMGSASTLTYFLEYSYNNYKTDLYDLVLWDHGAGPILGFGIDETNNSDSLSLMELRGALSNSPFSKSNKLEFIGFDACLMSSVEIAALFSEYANYLISSQDIEPGHGWDYSFLSNVGKETNSLDLGKNIVDYYYSYYENSSAWKEIITLSIIDLSKMKELENKINDLFKDVDMALSNGGYSTIVNQMTRSKCFQCNEYNKSYDLIDLYGAIEGLKDNYNTKASALLSVLDATIVYQKTNSDGANGLSIYYPYYSPAYATNWLSVYNTINFAPEYKKFINNHSVTLLGNKISDWNFKNTNVNVSSDGSEISVTLDDKVIADYNRSKFVIFKDMKDGYYSPIYTSTNTTLKNNGTLVANFNGKGFSLIEDTGDTDWVIAYEYQVGDDYTIYSVTTILQKFEGNISEWDTQIAYILVKVDAVNPNGKIVGIIPKPDPEDGGSAKKDINLKEWSTAEFWQFKYKIFDNNGNYTWDWTSSKTSYGFEVSPKKDFKIELMNLEKGFDYYCLFIIEDTQGNQYTTNLVKIK